MKEKQGISLVALIITIIVLIILTGAVIITMNQGDIIGKSEEAVFKSNITNYQDELSRKVLDKQVKGEISGMSGVTVEVKQLGEEGYNDYVNNIKEYIPSIKEEDLGKVGIKEGKIYYSDTTNEEEFEWAAELDAIDVADTFAGNPELEVGDYIKYTPGVGSYTATSEKTGYGTQAYIDWWENEYAETPTIENEGRQTFTSTTEEEMWRVLSVEGANVTIMRGEPTANLTLWGQTGYNNVEEVLNGICRVYKNEAYANSARSITIEDINKVTGYTMADMANYEGGSSYPGGYGYNKEINGITYTSDCYSYEGIDKISDRSSKVYTMIFTGMPYLVASRCIYAYNYANFNVQGVSNGYVNAYCLRTVNGDGIIECDFSFGACPVVVLKSTVSIADGSGTAEDPWKIE